LNLKSGSNRRKLLYEELHNLYSSPNIIMVIKLKILRRVGHVVSGTEVRNALIILLREAQEKIHLEYPYLGVMIILKWILKK
jgi:hypothetical protein